MSKGPMDEQEAEALTAAADATREIARRRYPIEQGRAFAALIEEGSAPIRGCGWVWVNKALYANPWLESQAELAILQNTIDEILDPPLVEQPDAGFDATT